MLGQEGSDKWEAKKHTRRSGAADKRPTAKRLVRACDTIARTVAHPEVKPFSVLAQLTCLNRTTPDFKYVFMFRTVSKIT